MRLGDDLPPGNVLRVRVTGDLIFDSGTWHWTLSHHERLTAIIEPPATPMFQQVLTHLWTKPVPTGGNLA